VGVGSRRVRIEDCIITGFVDKGVSVGEKAHAQVENTVVAYCAIGVGIKDEARAEIRGATFYKTNVGVECFEKMPGAGGGWARVEGSVFAHVRNKEVGVDAKSSLVVADCVSDKHLLEGKGNRLGIIRLIDPSRGRFEMASFSPRPAEGAALVEPQPRMRCGEVRTP